MTPRVHTIGNGYNGLTDTLTSTKLVFSCELLHTMNLIHVRPGIRTGGNHQTLQSLQSVKFARTSQNKGKLDTLFARHVLIVVMRQQSVDRKSQLIQMVSVHMRLLTTGDPVGPRIVCTANSVALTMMRPPCKCSRNVQPQPRRSRLFR